MKERKEQCPSVTATLTPIIAALVKAEAILGANRVWLPSNQGQSRFLERFSQRRGEIAMTLVNPSAGEPLKVASIASYRAEDINQFLARKGFNIALQPFTTTGEFGIASVMDVLVKWLHPGRSIQLMAANKQTYPGASLKEGVSIERSSGAENPVASIKTNHPDYKVGLTVPNGPVTDAFKLVNLVESIGKGGLSPSNEYNGLIFPKVSLDQRVNIDWLKGMQTTGDDGLPAYIAHALQQTRYRMNEIGARAESAVALGTMRSMAARENPLVIDRPFVCWMSRKGVSLPLFAGYIDYSDWKDPGSLE